MASGQRSRRGLLARRSLRAVLLAGAAALPLLASSAHAANIDTASTWDGSSSIAPWGYLNTATYGQTITPTSTQRFLTSITFHMENTGLVGPLPTYQAFVYQWDSVNKRITGSPLFASAVLTAPSNTSFTAVTVNTGLVPLTPGQKYVIFFTTSSQDNSATTSANYSWGTVDGTTYSGGDFVYQNNGADFSKLSTTAWAVVTPDDAAFYAMLQALLSPQLPSGAGANPTNIAQAIDNGVINSGSLPSAFLPLYLLSGQALTDALTAMTGENATQSQFGTFSLMDSFLSQLTEPVYGGESSGGPALGYADDGRMDSPAIHALAYAAGDHTADSAGPSKGAWGALLGSTGSVAGSASAGSNDTDNNLFGLITGFDMVARPDLRAGLSLGGGMTKWSVAAGGGTGHSRSFLAGLYASKVSGKAYVSGAAGFGWSWFGTSRSVTTGGPDTLTGDFHGQSYSGRVEAGFHFAMPAQVTFTPFGAVQTQLLKTSAYTESGQLGATDPFALSVPSRTQTATRTELGLTLGKKFASAGGTLDVFGRAAWAHAWVSNPATTVSFANLAGYGGFAVNGARPASDSALLSAGIGFKWNALAFTAMAKGQFGNGTHSYGAEAKVGVTW